MAVSKIKCTDWYTDGEAISLCGTWVALSGQAQPYNAGFTIPAKKRIPEGATITLSGLNVNWLRAKNASLTPVLHNYFISGDSVVVAIKATNMSPMDYYAAHIDAGKAIIHL